MAAALAMSIPTPIPTPDADDGALLQLMWLASPALPVGGFSYSEGLEAAVEHGLVQSETSAGAWLCDQLHLSLARADLAVVAQALRAWRAGHDEAAIHELDVWVRRTRETSELRLQTEQMGRSLREWHRSLDANAPSARTAAWTYPVAFAQAAAGSGATERQVLLAFAFGWAENMVQAAIKSVPLGQSAGQRILQALAVELPSAVDTAMALGEGERQSFSPMLAILSARHEHQYSRLFRS